MSKTIIISHGDKGGCGKSHVAMVVGSELAKTNTPMLIIDADAIENGDGGDGDVAGRFGSYAQSSVQSISTRLTGEQGDSERRVGQMLDLIEESDASIVLINLPANASQTLEEQGELLAEMVQEFNHHLYVLYSFEPMAASVAGAVASANGAIISRLEHHLDMVCSHICQAPSRNEISHLKSAKRHMAPLLASVVPSFKAQNPKPSRQARAE